MDLWWDCGSYSGWELFFDAERGDNGGWDCVGFG